MNPQMTAGLTWGISEVSIGLIVASMVSLRSLFNDIFNVCRRCIHHSRIKLKNEEYRDEYGDADLERRLTGSTRKSRTRSKEIRELEFRTERETKRANRWWDEECKEREGSKESSRGRTLTVAFGIGSRTSSRSNTRGDSRARSQSNEEEVQKDSTVFSIAEPAPVVLRD